MYEQKEKRKGKPLGWRAGMGLIFIGFIIIVGIVIYFVSKQADIPLSLTPFPAIFLLAGTLVIFTDVLESKLDLEDEIESFSELISDDMEALRHGRLTRAVWMLILTAISVVIWVVLIVSHHKWFATWGNFNVVGIGLLLSVICVVVGLKSGWFQERYMRTSIWLHLLLFFGFLASAAAGIYFTEPIEAGGPTQSQVNAAQQDTYNWNGTRASHIVIFSSNIGSGSSSSSASFAIPKCSGKGCMGIVIIAVIALVVICIIGSALVMHFWVAATMVLLAVMSVFSLRELLFYDHRTNSW